MTSHLLTRLTQEDFELSIGFHHTPETVRRSLLKSDDVQKVAIALRKGEITEDTIREFVSSLISGFSRGCRLPHDLALAALAVVLELRPTEFAEEFLHDLARLKLAEMSLSVNVARVCLKTKFSTAKNQSRTFSFRPAGRLPLASRPMLATRPMPNSTITYHRVMRYPQACEVG